MCTLNTTILAKNNSSKLLQFSRKIYIVHKIGPQNEFGRVFEVLPPGYVAINRNFSPIPYMCTLNTIILVQKNFWKLLQFSRKIYLCAKLPWKNEFGQILKSSPMAMWQSMEISGLFHTCGHKTLPFWLKELMNISPIFQDKLTFVQNWPKNEFDEILKSYPQNFSSFQGNFTLRTTLAHKMSLVGFLKSEPLVMRQSMEISVPFHPCVYQTLPFWMKKAFENSSSFSRKTYIVWNICHKMSLVRFWNLTLWLGGNQWRFQSYSTHVHTEYSHSG